MISPQRIDILFLLCPELHGQEVCCPGPGRIGEGIVHAGGLRNHARPDGLDGRARGLGDLGGRADPGPDGAAVRKVPLRMKEQSLPGLLGTNEWRQRVHFLVGLLGPMVAVVVEVGL
jgi:hypothetical protein